MNKDAQPERLNHAHITVPMAQLDDARNFYCGIVGLTEIEKPEVLKVYPGFWVRLAGLELHIGGDDTPIDRWASGAHLAFEVDDLAERRARLEEAGIEIKAMVFYPGFDRFEFRDPYGNRMELMTRTPVATPDLKAAQ